MLARFHPSPATGIAFIALIVALGGSAYAVTSFVGSDGKIHGCVSKSGQLVLVKAGAKCKTGQSGIAWNQRGPRGLRGPRGFRGQMGAQGLPGPTFAVSRTADNPADPPASPDETSSEASTRGRSFDFTLPVAGKVYVRFYSPHLGRDCSAGSASAGMYLDGAPVSNSDHAIEPGSAPGPAEFVAVTPAAAGAHTVQVREDCPSGFLASGGDSLVGTWTVLLVGG